MPTITTSDSGSSLELDILLSHIRLRGIAVGNPEMQRLHAVFAQAPVLSRNELRYLLTATLAKDEWQRSQIGRVFDRLVPFESDGTDQNSLISSGKQNAKLTSSHTSSNEIEDDEEDSDGVDLKKSFRWQNLAPKTIFKISLAALFSVIISIVILEVTTTPKPTQAKPVAQKQSLVLQSTEQKEEVKPDEQDLKLVRHIDHWIPHVESRPRDPWPQLIPALLMLFGSGLGFSWLLYKILEKSRQQKAKRPRLIQDNGRFQVAGIGKPADYHLLSGEQRREMRWGIGRYQSEQPLDRLNIPLSVQRSAIAGMPQLAFGFSQNEREVWLWQDSGSHNPDLCRLAEEIQHSLQRANINVRLGYFRGVPSTVRGERGEVLWSLRHDYPETEPLVVVFADADQMAQDQYHRSDQAEQSLRQLSHWPRLCFVDCSQQAGTLQRLLNPQTLDCILPQAVPNWLATQGQSSEQPVGACVIDSLRQWAMACALPNRVIMEDEIRALHNALGFDCGWHFHAVTSYAKVGGRGFDFRVRRKQLLNELSLGDQSFAKKATQFWIARNKELDEALLEKQPQGHAWKLTRKQKQLERDTGLLKLWLLSVDKPTFTQGISTLYDLNAHERLQQDISRELSHYRCHGFKTTAMDEQGNAQHITLPFHWNEVDVDAQRQLIQCGFGGQADPNVKLHTDKTSLGVLVGLATLMVACIVMSVYFLKPKDVQIELRVDSAEPPAELRILPKQNDNYLAATYKSIGRYEKPEYIQDHAVREEDRVITTHWQRQAVQRAQVLIDESNPASAQHWLLGTIANPKRPQPSQEQWPDLSIVVIYGDPKNMTVRKLAAKLLDTGSADQILIGKGHTLRAQHERLIKQTELVQDTQWIYINGRVLPGHENNQNTRVAELNIAPQKLLNELRQSNETIDVTKLEGAEQLGGNLSSLLQAQKEQALDGPITLANNLTLIKIPQGSFQMGSDKGDDDEKPIHTVTINYDFWMSQTEITFEQYDAYIADIKHQTNSPSEGPEDEGWGRGQQPVMNVSWDDAQAYVKWLNDTLIVNSKDSSQLISANDNSKIAINISSGEGITFEEYKAGLLRQEKRLREEFAFVGLEQKKRLTADTLIVNSKDNSQLITTTDNSKITINMGITLEEYEAGLLKQEKRLREAFDGSEQTKRLTAELAAVLDKLDNLNVTYERTKSLLEAADKALVKLADQLPAAQIKEARERLAKNDTQAAKRAFNDIIANGSLSIALSEYKKGKLEESGMNYIEALKSYRVAALLDKSNPDYPSAIARLEGILGINSKSLQCRLPSEAEWEYAARAGMAIEHPWVDEMDANNVNCNGCGSKWDGQQPSPVGSFKPNAFGLNDMYGNVWEWVQDTWHNNYNGAPDNGEAWEDEDTSGEATRIVRGGSWADKHHDIYSGGRGASSPGREDNYIGFRIVCSDY